MENSRNVALVLRCCVEVHSAKKSGPLGRKQPNVNRISYQCDIETRRLLLILHHHSRCPRSVGEPLVLVTVTE